MKYIKLFENYTRCEFGMYTDNDKIDSLWQSLEFDNPVNMPFSPEEEKKLEDILKPIKGSVYADQGSAHFDIRNLTVVVKGYGDYCFGIFVEDLNLPDNEMWIQCEIIDGFEDLCISLEKLIKG